MAKFVCPRCREGLSLEKNTLVCDSCGEGVYPIEGGIPDFVSSGEGGDRMTKFFDYLSAIYETPFWYPLAVRLIGGPSVDETVEWVARRFETAETVVDIATGTGVYARGIATNASQVYAIDLSRGMLKKAQAYARREGKQIEFARANVESLPFADNTFDGVSCCGALHLFPDELRAMKEMYRVLRPDGTLAVLTLTERGPFKSSLMRAPLEAQGVDVFKLDYVERLVRRAGFEGFEYETHGGVLLFEARKK